MSSPISRASAPARPIAGRWKRAIRGWRCSLPERQVGEESEAGFRLKLTPHCEPSGVRIVARKPAMIPTRRSGIAFAGGPVLEPVADHDQRAFTPSGRLGFARRRRFDFNWPVVLGHGFERAQEFPTRRRDLPPLVIAQHVTVAKDIDDRDAARETLDARVPVRTAGCEDSDVSFEGSKRSSAATVTGQDLQNGNLYTHTNAFGPPPRFF